MLLHGADDALGRVQPEVTAAERATLPNLVGKRIIDGAGHFVPHEKPNAVASALLELLNGTRP